MQDVGAVLRAEGVRAILLAHGTFVGPDALGMLAELARVFPSASANVQRIIKRVFDHFTGDAGNYTGSYAQLFESALAGPGQPRIPVELFCWSSENHHIGRADGAVRLIARLAALDLEPGDRVLLWGHSHAGNVFALMTNLLAGNREAVERFFDAAEIYYRWPLFGWVDIPLWEHVRDLLLDDSFLRGVALDLVTFGTPVRYGWDSEGYARLLHFINRRPSSSESEYRASFPVQLDDVLNATEGDYVQQLGIAGTNTLPSIFSWRAWVADQKLNELLQEDEPMGGSLDRFQAGTIIPDEGTTLLVDYGEAEGGIGQHLAGHAVYTRKAWLLFHAEEVTRRFYSLRACRAA